MKINNNQAVGYNNANQLELPVELKEGDIYPARIKERISDHEAVLQVKGREVRATFEGKVPDEERSFIQITERGEQTIQVRTVSDPGKQAQSDTDAIAQSRQEGGELHHAINRTVKILQDRGVALDKEAFQQLKKFVEAGPGSLPARLETIQAIANKRLEVSTAHLLSVHEALHGTSIADAVKNASNTTPISKDLAIRIREILQQEPNLEKAVQQIRAELARVADLGTEAAANMEKVLVKLSAESDPVKLVELLQALASDRGGSSDNALSSEPHTLQSVVRRALAILLLTTEGIGSEQPASARVHQSSPAHVFAQINQIVQNESNLEQVIKQVRGVLAGLPADEQPVFAGLEKALTEAGRLKQVGWDALGRDRIGQAMQQVEKELLISKASANGLDGLERDQAVPSVYDRSEDGQLASLLATKDLVVTEITKRLSEAANQFRTLKREIARNIDNMINVAKNNRTNVMAAVKPLLENTIDLLDKAILKSDITMLTDMQTEKDLMHASTQLAEARRLLAKGENSQAAAILREVKAKLESINWRPSHVRVQHFLTSDSLFLEQAPSMHKLAGQVTHAVQHFQEHEPSARNTFEFFRSLGYNHDSEVAQALASDPNGLSNRDTHHNLKTALLHLARSEGEQTPGQGVTPQTEQALNNLTGQQLLSKSEPGANLQSMFFSLPLLLGGNMENVKLYINAKNEGQKIDWENCSLYFLLETPKMGPTGILLSAVDRNLSVTVKNDNPQMKAVMEPLLATCKEHLEEIGYRMTGVHFARLNEQKREAQLPAEKPAAKPQQTNPYAKGFDFKI